ncbi:hypothetical protein CYG48_05950 [Neorhizobium sp. SOG26]|nr:hypothetical protein CYG48_05950 [Neorhizobium sp. SOG26]
MLIAPHNITLPYIIPGHSYLFKSASGWREQQIWSEVIAYRLAKSLDLPVPPCFIAHDSCTGATGVLVEFFFGYPGEESPARLVHAVDAIMSIFQSGVVGQPHTVLSNAKVTRVMLGQGFGMDWWAAAYAFDALIGNTDRHTENWGFLVRRTATGETHYEIAPLFDNGTSLGFQFPEKKLKDCKSPDAITLFNQRGLHQCGWDIQNPRRLGHFELCEKLLESYPSSETMLRRVADLNISDADEILQQCTTYEVPVAFTERRAEYLRTLIRSRKDILSRLL